MADISMCKGTDCPLKYKCYRFTAIANQFRQSYYIKVPYNKEKEKCTEYWNNKEYIKQNYGKNN